MSKQWYCPKCGPDVAVVHWGGAYGGVRCAECKAHAQSEPPRFVTAMRQRIAELEALIADAPHSDSCCLEYVCVGSGRDETRPYCNCWKSKALREAGFLKEQG